VNDMVELFKHDLLLDLSKNKSVLHIGACDYPYHKERASAGKLLHQKLKLVARELVGIDNNRRAIEELQKLGITDIYYGDIIRDEYEIDLSRMTFDVILLADILEHLENPGVALLNIKKFMNPTTKLVVTIPNVFGRNSIKYILTGNENVHPDHTFWPSVKTMSNLFNRVKLHVHSILYCEYGEYSEISTRGKMFYKLVLKRLPHLMNCLMFVVTTKEHENKVIGNG